MQAVSKAGVEFIKALEGYREEPYFCAGGRLTVGYGTTKGVSQDSRVTQEEAERLLIRDLKDVESVLNEYVSVPLSQNQFDALASFVYNVGRYAFRSSSLLKWLNTARYDRISSELRRWVHAKGRVIKGLEKRRQKEAELFCKR